ncbi:hypothetical protein LCGC14_0533540 [marine sediment metagenome]|uniref:Uncharacterized protein n=1 Tax=marine sediment metagenome TaxID=412755 RepID=A0A0F9RZQ8_9ZZZZ
MRYEGYTFSIFCDGKDRKHHIRSCDHFTGKNAGRCRWQARKAGWKLKNKKDLCPDCHAEWLAARQASRAKKLKEKYKENYNE